MSVDMETLLKEYIRDYGMFKTVQTKWQEPLIGYADAKDQLFYQYKEVIGSTYVTPDELLKGAKTVIAYFIPFHEDIVKSNLEGRGSSRAWAIAYEETNQLIFDLNEYIKGELQKAGYEATVNTKFQKYDRVRLTSDWSQRHAAFVTGLGKFGLNNMFITEKGCTGRIGTIVTNMYIPPTKREEGEYCLYKTKNSCKKCIARCVVDALKEDSYDRKKCNEMCEENAKLHEEVGHEGSCGKCLAGVPCSFGIPGRV